MNTENRSREAGRAAGASPAVLRAPRGMTFIDVIIGTAIMLIVFLALFGAFKLSIELVYNTKAKTGGVALVTERMEHIRSLPYESIGTVGGIPAGTIDQLEQVSLNGITYTLRTLILYEDAPEDGLDLLDENGITADYKVAKVEALWTIRGNSRATFAVTRISPTGVESLTGGGTLRVNIFDATAAPVSGASVRILNPGLAPQVDVSVTTNAAGTVVFPGAPEGAGYELQVTKTGYSTAATYDVTVENPNPNPGHVAVVEGQTTTASFSIDLLGSLSVRTFEPIGAGSFDDTLDGQSNLVSTTTVEVTGGELVLEATSGEYALSGSAHTITVQPEYLAYWDEALFTLSTPPGTDLRAQVYEDTGSTYALVPDEDLPGNSAGFSSGLIDLSALSASEFPKLKLGFELATTDMLITPSLAGWSISYYAGPTPLPHVAYRIHGTQVVGDTGSGPIYKFDTDDETDATGIQDYVPIEWDTYIVLPDVALYDVAERCPNVISVAPDTNLIANLVLVENGAHSLKVYVEESGVPIVGASVNLAGGAFDETYATGACGQVFFGDVSAGTYTLTITKSGYQPYIESALSVSGNSETAVSLSP